MERGSRRVRRRMWSLIAGLAAMVVLAGACGGEAKPSASSSPSTTAGKDPTTSSSTTSPPASSTSTSSTSITVARNPYLLAPGQVTFLSPSGNIACEIDYGNATLPKTAFCQTASPADSAKLSPAGSVTICGASCQGNPGEGTPTLAYGDSTGLGPFRCSSATEGVTCLVSGIGFEISRGGITPVDAPLVTLAPGSYSGTIDTVSSNGPRMTFTIARTGCNGVPIPGRWSVNLSGASFTANTDPTTGQGQAVTLTASQWLQEEQHRSAWTLVAATNKPLEVTDGPTC